MAVARRTADGLVEILSPLARQVAIAGSLRRGRAGVKDIELVVEPRPALDLFGEASSSALTDVDLALDELVRSGVLARRKLADGTERWGPRYKAALSANYVPIDIFLVRPPAQWGAILAIRTGPALFSKSLVTVCRRHGRRLVEGRLVDRAGKTIDTPTERSFFAACGVAWVEPEARR